MSRRSAVCALLVFLAAVSVPARAQEGQADAEVQQKIRQVSLDLDSAYRRGDAEAISGLFTEDAIVSPIEVEDLHGPAAIRAALAGFFVGNVVAAFQLQPVEIAVYGPTAYERGTFVWSSGPRGQRPRTVRGRYSAVWVRTPAGDWRIRRYIENLLPSATQQR